LVSPVGPAPAQSLLAVLASYILPGSGPLPAGTIVLLVMLGVMLVAACAPRPGGSERIWLSGLLGPGRGHGLAVRRPG
jgi:peptidoglycan/LPS O-acetylase OafA/YrhL